MKPTEIAKKLTSIKKELKKVQLIAVTKYSAVNDIVVAYEAGQFDFGENRVSELLEKSFFFNENNLNKVKWHFIGHLQTNKVRELFKVHNLHAIHSVDSISLLEELIKRENDLKQPELKIFFQVNTSREIEKSGFETAEDLELAINLLKSRKGSKLKLFGLMTMGTFRTANFEVEAERCFNELKRIAEGLEVSFSLKDKLKLSMGMSQDYKIAINSGSDFIRIGSAIFK
jgi:pyridoxal phosphate enzyme (YggS family)